MIEAALFRGDNDQKTMLKQYDSYSDALGIIVQSCNRIAVNAKLLLSSNDCKNWGTIWRFDHRTLQSAHDCLAAAFRFKNDGRQLKLRLEPNLYPSNLKTSKDFWFYWLSNEVENWVWEPSLVRCVQIILANQNQPVGYEAESRLTLEILDRFPEVPWDENLREAAEQNLDKTQEEISRAATKYASAHETACDCTARGKAPCHQEPCKTTCQTASSQGWGPLQ